MKSLRALALSIAAGAMLSLSPVAANAGGSLKDAPAAAPFSWTGFYWGSQVGVSIMEDRFKDPAYVPVITGTIDMGAPVFGSHAGYNYQRGNVVAGIELDFEHALGSDSSAPGFIGGTGAPFVTGGAELNWQASVRGRLGLVRDNTLYYATAGIAWGNFDFSYTFPTVGGTTDSFSETLVGWTVGAGIETLLSGNWTARIEYRYTDFGSASGSIINCCAPPPNAQDHDVDSHTIRVGLSRKF